MQWSGFEEFKYQAAENHQSASEASVKGKSIHPDLLQGQGTLF
jgi:hypothetical protein